MCAGVFLQPFQVRFERFPGNVPGCASRISACHCSRGTILELVGRPPSGPRRPRVRPKVSTSVTRIIEHTHHRAALQWNPDQFVAVGPVQRTLREQQAFVLK